METKHLFDLHIDSEASGFLAETAKWGKFLAILGFISCGFCILMALFYNFIPNAEMEAMAGTYGNAPVTAASRGALIGVYAVLGVLMIFPYRYLYRFSTGMQRALQGTDQEEVNQSLRNLKSCFKFVGVMSIIGLAFLILSVIFAVIAYTVAA